MSVFKYHSVSDYPSKLCFSVLVLSRKDCDLEMVVERKISRFCKHEVFAFAIFIIKLIAQKATFLSLVIVFNSMSGFRSLYFHAI